MLAHRVENLGAILAVLILSVELLGAVAWKHHAVASRYDRWATLRGTELVLDHARAKSLDSALEQVTLARQLLEPNPRD